MARFRYVALSSDGRRRAGMLDAPSEDAAVAALSARGEWALSIRVEDGPGRGARAVSEVEIAVIARELSTMLKAGVPLDRALAILGELATGRGPKTFIARALERIKGGEPLSAALEQAGMDSVGGRIGLLRAGEAAGDVATALTRLASTIERAEALKGAIRNALIYPAVVATAALGAIALLVAIVLPRFREIFASAGAELPGAAGALLALSDWMIGNWLEASVGVAAAMGALVLWGRSEAGALALSKLGLVAPVAGSVLRRLDAARFCRTLGVALQSGAPAVEAADHAAESMGRLAMRRAARGVSGDLGAGKGLADAMAATGAFPALALGLARVGEESGAAPQMLTHAADMLEGQAERTARQAVQLIAPAATLLLGGLVAMIVVSLMTAMLSLNEVI